MIKVGVIGVGDYGQQHLNVFSQREKNNKDIKVIGFAETNEERRKKIELEYGYKGYDNYLDLIEYAKPDAITIATPDHLHFKVVMDCLDKKIPSLVEKPFSTKVEEAKKMAEKAKQNNIFLQIDFHKRYDPYHIDLKMRIVQGELGKIQYGYCWMEDTLDVGTKIIGKKAWENTGSPAWFLSIHQIDLTYWLMGCPKPLKVYANGFKGKLKSMGIDIYDSIKSNVMFDNGVVITYDSCVILPNTHEALVHQGVKMVGTEGFMEVDSQYRGARGCTTIKGMETPNLGFKYRIYDKANNIQVRGYLYDSINDFIDNIYFLKSGHMINELKGLQASPEQGIESTKIGVAIHESIEKGGLVDISNW